MASELLEPKDRLWRQVHGVKLSLCDVTQVRAEVWEAGGGMAVHACRSV